MKFEWHQTKARRNRLKHGVNFEEAITVFTDPLALIFDDKWHSIQEDREIIIGHTNNGRLLLVSFVQRGDAVRIISARATTKKERKNYEKNAYRPI